MPKAKTLLLVLGMFFLLGGFKFVLAQTEPFSDSADQRIEKLQKIIDEKGYYWTAGRSWVSELSIEEFKKLLGYKPPRGYKEWLEKQPKLRAKPGMLFPPHFDWRDSNIVTPVKNQRQPQQCGSCWDFAATGAFEAAIKKHDGIEYDLSEQQVLSCNIYTHTGCYGAWAEAAYELFQRHGAILESAMPYQASHSVPCTQDLYPVVAKLKGWQYVNNDINSIKQALLTGPVSSFFEVFEDFYYGYSSGCYQYTSGQYLGGHVIVIVGWDDTSCAGEGAWICKNSWGPEWGMEGYFKIKFNDNSGIGENTVLPLYPPDPVTLSYYSHQVYEAAGDGDGIPEPGETITLEVDLKNTGTDTATSVQATLSTTIPGINITDEVASFPDIPFNQIKTSIPPHFTFQIDSSVEVGTRVDFNLNITCNQGGFSGSLCDFIGKFDTAFFDDMETNRGWTTGFFENLSDWQRGTPGSGGLPDPETAHSGTKIWGNNLNGNYSDNTDNYLDSPIINCNYIEKARLQYYRWLSCERGIYDHAKIFVNGNLVWENDPNIDQVDHEWEYQDIDISAYADTNPSVQIRYELDSDDYLHLGGWSIDDFAIVGIAKYISGDANNDEKLNVSDVIYLINYLFKGGAKPVPVEAGDANCDGHNNVSDVIFLINYLFKGGPAPCEPE